MENASKALLIAAAVLIVILLIAFGMRIFNSTSGTTDSLDKTMSSAETAAFNNKFTAYLGTQSTAKAKTLVNMILVNNQKSAHKIKVTYTILRNGPNTGIKSEGEKDIADSRIANGILVNLSETKISKIKISIEKNDDNGYISVINFDNSGI